MGTNFYCTSVNFIYHCLEVFCFATFLPALTRASLVRLAAEEAAHSFGSAAFWGVKFPVTSGFIPRWLSWTHFCVEFPLGALPGEVLHFTKALGLTAVIVGVGEAPSSACSLSLLFPRSSSTGGFPAQGLPSLAALLVTPCSLELQCSPSHLHSPLFMSFSFSFLVLVLSLSVLLFLYMYFDTSPL